MLSKITFSVLHCLGLTIVTFFWTFDDNCTFSCYEKVFLMQSPCLTVSSILQPPVLLPQDSASTGKVSKQSNLHLYINCRCSTFIALLVCMCYETLVLSGNVYRNVHISICWYGVNTNPQIIHIQQQDIDAMCTFSFGRFLVLQPFLCQIALSG